MEMLDRLAAALPEAMREHVAALPPIHGRGLLLSLLDPNGRAQKESLSEADVGSALDEGRVLPAIFTYRPLNADGTPRVPAPEDIRGAEFIPRIFIPRQGKRSGRLALPLEFVPNARRMGVLPLIDAEILYCIERFCAALGQKGAKGTLCTLNTSTQSLTNQGFIAAAIATASTLRASGARLGVELLEQDGLTEPVIAHLRQMIREGVEICCDDFPAERSAQTIQVLGQRNLGLSTLKVDGKTVDGLGRKAHSQEILKETVRRAQGAKVHSLILEGRIGSRGIPHGVHALLKRLLCDGDPAQRIDTGGLNLLIEGRVKAE